MAKILTQDPATGFVTVQLDDGRTSVAPADVVARAFPGLTGQDPNAGFDAPPVGALPAEAPVAPATSPWDAYAQPGPEAMSTPDPGQVAPGPTAPAAPAGPAEPANPFSSVAAGHSGSVRMNTAGPAAPKLDVNPDGGLGAFDEAAQGVVDSEEAKRQAVLQEAGNKLAVQPALTQAAYDTYDQMKQETARREQATQDVQAQLQTEDQRVQATLNEIPRMDPHRFWNDKDKFAQSIGIASAAIAGFLNPLSSKNQVVESVMAMIDQDMRGQETDIATSQFLAGAQERAYGRLATRLEGDEVAKHELALYKLETVKAELAAKMASFGSDFTKAEYAGILADLDVQSSKLHFDMTQLRHGQYMADMDFKLRSWAAAEQVKTERGQLGVSWAEHNRLAAKDAAEAKATKVIPTLEPRDVIGAVSGFQTDQGRDFIVPGETDTERKENALAYKTSSNGVISAVKGMRKLQSMDFSFLGGKLSPEEKQKQAAAMAQAVMGTMTAEGVNFSRTSDKEGQMIRAMEGGDLTLLQSMVDSDGHVRKEILAGTINDVIEQANRDAQSRGPVMDAEVNAINQRLTAAGAPTLTIDQLREHNLLRTAQFIVPEEVSAFQTELKEPSDILAELNAPIPPKGSLVGTAAATVSGAEILLKEAKAGRFDSFTGNLMDTATSIHGRAAVMEKSDNPAVRNKADRVRKLAQDLADTAVARAKALKGNWGGRFTDPVIKSSGLEGMTATDPGRARTPTERNRDKLTLPPWARGE